MFNDYDLLANELGFRGRTVRALAAASHRIRHLQLADSIGIDFHKTGFAPYVSSLVLVRDRPRFRPDRPRRERRCRICFNRANIIRPCSRWKRLAAGTGPMAALANLLLLGKEGLRVLLGHAVEMAEVLRELIESHPNLTVLNGENVGPVTLFRAYPDGVDTFTSKTASAPTRLSRSALRPQRLQPPDLRAGPRRSPRRPRRGDFADRLLPADRLRRPDRRPKVLRPLALLR